MITFPVPQQAQPLVAIPAHFREIRTLPRELHHQGDQHSSGKMVIERVVFHVVPTQVHRLPESMDRAVFARRSNTLRERQDGVLVQEIVDARHLPGLLVQPSFRQQRPDRGDRGRKQLVDFQRRLHAVRRKILPKHVIMA